MRLSVAARWSRMLSSNQLTFHDIERASAYDKTKIRSEIGKPELAWAIKIALHRKVKKSAICDIWEESMRAARAVTITEISDLEGRI
jgi:hypothetical protein